MAEEVRRDIIHHMGRRCRDWDYGGRAIYMITINLKERGRPVMAEWPRFLDVSAEAQEQNLPVSGQAQNRPGNGRRSASARFCASAETAKLPCASAETPKVYMPLTPLGEKVLSCWRRIPEFWLMVELLECQVMPDHFHGLLFVKGALLSSSGRPKTLGDVVRGFKTGCREVGWEEGYVDNILFREGQLKRMADYIRDNPRRLAEKRANPGLFRHVADLTIDLLVSEQAQNRPVSGQAQNRAISEQAQKRAAARPEQLQLFPEHDLRQPGNGPISASAETARFCSSPETAKSFRAHFSAIGNAALLRWPVILQVQCSRSDFRYQRVRLPTGGWKILRNAAGEPLVEYASPAFEAKCEDALRCAKNGAALISPCISHGEREIARRAHLAGMRVIALCNKGFSKFEKPNGALFDQCAKGNLLMLAPAAWPYVPGEKPPTRESSLVLNRIAQLIAGEGRAEIKYNGMVLKDIDSKVREALRPRLDSVIGSVPKEEADFVRKAIAEQHVIDEEMWK